MTKVTSEIRRFTERCAVISSPTWPSKTLWFAGLSKLIIMKMPSPQLVSRGIQHKFDQLHILAIFPNNFQMWKRIEIATNVVTGPPHIDICLRLCLHSGWVPTRCTSRWLLTPFSSTCFKVRALSLLEGKIVSSFFNVHKSLLGLSLALINFKGSWKKH